MGPTTISAWDSILRSLRYEVERGSDARGCTATLVLSCSTAFVAASTGAPKLRSRPPNATAQTANHAHPKASPAIASDNQWTPSITRLVATATAIATAPAAISARVTGARRRARTSATAAYVAAAVAE